MRRCGIILKISNELIEWQLFGYQPDKYFPQIAEKQQLEICLNFYSFWVSRMTHNLKDKRFTKWEQIVKVKVKLIEKERLGIWRTRNLVMDSNYMYGDIIPCKDVRDYARSFMNMDTIYWAVATNRNPDIVASKDKLKFDLRTFTRMVS